MNSDRSLWLARNLLKHDEVATAERIGPGLVSVKRKTPSRPSAIVGVVAVKRVTVDDVDPFLVSGNRPDIIINVPNNALWDGSAIELLESEGIAFGKMYDLYRGLNQEGELSQYQNPEFFFTERIFDQNDHVAYRERVSDRAYRLSMMNGEVIVVVLSQDYEVTADTVRTSYSDHKPFDILLKTNPYGRISTEAVNVAAEVGIRLADAKSFYKVLRR